MNAFRMVAGGLLVLVFFSMGHAQISGVSSTGASVGQTAAPVSTVVTTAPVTPTPNPVVPVGVLNEGPTSGSSGITPVPPLTTPPQNLTPGAGMSLPRVLQIANNRWSGSTNLVNVSTARPGSFPARLSNVSVRGYVGPGSPLIGGGVIAGASSLPTFARAAGPTLKLLGVGNPLQWPSLAVYEGSSMAAETNYVQSTLTPVAAYVGAFPSTMGDPMSGTPTDAALTGQPGAGNLTGVCTSGDNGTGIALVEFYDASNAPSAMSPRFQNFSGRARVVSGEGVLIVGFVVAGDDGIKVLLRGVGASLVRFGVTDPLLPDPILELYRDSTLMATSDNWRAESRTSTALSDTANQVGAFPLTDPNEAALMITLPAGSYSLQLRDTQGRSGVGLAEIYEVPVTQ